MALDEIMVYGNQVLRHKSEPVTEFGPELQKTVDEMFNLMYKSRGIGLAAPQVGINQRFIVIDIQDYDGPKIALINPQIVSKSRQVETDEEGCLSIPGVRGLVDRAKKITVKAQNPQGEEIEITARNLYARVIQHEMDHLDGILFTDRVQDQTQEMDSQLKALRKSPEFKQGIRKVSLAS